MTLKGILWGLMGIFVFVNVFVINVVVHEWGHYIAAENYGLRPEIKYSFENLTEVGFSLNSINIASTSFIDNGDDGQLRVIAAVGPFFNLILGAIFLTFFVFIRKKWIKEGLFIALIVSFSSFVMNMIPFPGSDGSLIFG